MMVFKGCNVCLCCFLVYLVCLFVVVLDFFFLSFFLFFNISLGRKEGKEAHNDRFGSSGAN